MGKLMIYGATGYTGRLICQHAHNLGLRFILGGRSQDKLAELGAHLAVPYLAFGIDDSHAIAAALENVKVLLNCAGPIGKSAEPLMAACIEKGIHYLDDSAELLSYQLAERLSEKAEKRGVMLLPGCGGSAAMLGCLVFHAVQSVENVVSVDIALCITGSISRGSVITATNSLSTECLQRCDGILVPQDINNTQQFDFNDGKGPVPCSPVTLPDLITTWKTTGIPNIKTFVAVSADLFGNSADTPILPDGPTPEEREESPYHVAVTVTTQEGDTKRSVLHTVNGYTFTAIASVEAAERALTGKVNGGFQTPALVFGEDLYKRIPSSKIVDI
ncbi:hypothetical protein O1611_g5053 [Lasiodiplodia mahajangana]|uniref:Uncharacterized protein n=1 Tax=Lasiodiplodia mahajangana TaxID=1108764 RepID=A0ACC2JM88_9PEZI|nr:hypothetical protein O1611_g5053 [Lasiodiplodia mahajangana]